MSLVPVKYALDRSGKATANLVDAELHQLNNANYRVLVPRHGAFFTESLSLREVSTGRLLVPGVDFYPAMLYTTPTKDTGKEVHQLVIITNPLVTSEVYFSAQMLGGEYSYSWDAIVQLIHSLELDKRSVLFDNIIGKPEAWDPTPHLHDIGDVFGFEFQVAGLERIRQAIMLGAGGQTKAIYQLIENELAAINRKVDESLGSQMSKASLLRILGYTPANTNGDNFNGAVGLLKGQTLNGYFKEKIARVTATTNQTTLDLALSTVFEVTLTASTTFRFDTSKVTDLKADEAISFTMVLKNDGVANRAAAFGTNVRWSGKTIPPRSQGANAIDEYYFSSFDGGVTWTGSLSNANVGQAV